MSRQFIREWCLFLAEGQAVCYNGAKIRGTEGNMDRGRLEEQLRELPLVQYEFFETRDLVFTPRVRAVCEMECHRYGTSWACPPGVGTVEECRARCLAYPEGLLIVTMTEVDPGHPGSPRGSHPAGPPYAAGPGGGGVRPLHRVLRPL